MGQRFNSTRWSIVLGAASADPVRQDAFSRRYAPLVRAFLASRWRTASDDGRIDDAVQEVFLQCFRPGGALERIDPSSPGGFRAYFCGVIRNVAAESDRRDARNREQPAGGTGELDSLRDDLETPERAFDRAWAQMVAEEAYDLMRERGGIDARRRIAAMRLRYHEGVPPREIAEMSGNPVEEVYRLLEAGRSQFRTALLEVMRIYHPGSSESVLEGHCRELLSLL